MKIKFFTLLFSLIFSIQFVVAQSLSDDPNFTMVYNDELDNLDNWVIKNEQIPAGATGGLYMSNSLDNVEPTSYGTVKLNTTRIPNTNIIFRNGVIQTKDPNTIPLLPDFFVEVRAKFKNGPNASLALWFHGGDGGCNPSSWCDYREMDLLEYFGELQLTSGGIHYCSEYSSPQICKRAGNPGSNINPENRYAVYNQDNYNLYGSRWNKNVMTIFFNNSIKVHKPTPTDRLKTNDVPLKFVFGVNIRCWDNPVCNNDASNFPYTSEVDYLRIYTIKKDCNTVITQIPNFNTFNYSLKKSFNLSGTTTIPSNEKVSIYATDFFEFQNGFSIPDGTDFSATLTDCGL